MRESDTICEDRCRTIRWPQPDVSARKIQVDKRRLGWVSCRAIQAQSVVGFLGNPGVHCLHLGTKADQERRPVMAEVKGKFITLACDLIKSKPEARQAAIDAVRKLTGKDPYELDPEGWYNTKVFDAVFTAIETSAAGIMGWAAIKVIGQLVYPTIKTTAGLPPHLKTPLDFVTFEADGFLQNHRGSDVIPRKFVTTEDGNIVVDAPSPGYNCTLIEGVFEGILHICGIGDGVVKQTQCVKRGDPTCVYHITWGGKIGFVGSGVDWSSRTRE